MKSHHIRVRHFDSLEALFVLPDARIDTLHAIP